MHALRQNLPLNVILGVVASEGAREGLRFEHLFEAVETDCGLLAVARDDARAPVVEKRVDRYAAEPSVEARLSAEASERTERLEPDLLREVFGVFGPSAVVQRERVDAPLVRAREPAEGFEVALFRPTYQFVFAGQLR